MREAFPEAYDEHESYRTWRVYSQLLLEGIDEVEIRKEQNVIVVVPVTADDLILGLGKQPITLDVEDASVNHDGYLSGR